MDESVRLSGLSMVHGLQHALAAVGGIVAAPLIIALGMGLSAEDTRYIIGAALVISGVATVLQIVKIGPFGSGLLSIQGTSFAFVGPLIFVFHDLSARASGDSVLGIVFGSALICALVMVILTPFIRELRRVVTTNVTSLTLVLIGASLVITTTQNLWSSYAEVAVPQQNLIVSGLTLLTLVTFTALPFAHFRPLSIVASLVAGTMAATYLGWISWSEVEINWQVFYPKVLPFGFGLDWMTVFILLPIFLVSATESIGDLTATNALSGYTHGDSAYWRRIRGGLMGDALNSVVASVFATFPNTTFSQNNGLIRLTGISRPTVGLYAAAILIGLGLVPVFSILVQMIPVQVVSTVTVVLFALVALAGLQLFLRHVATPRDYAVFMGGAVGGYGLSMLAEGWQSLPELVVQFLSFPVSTGALIGMSLELLLPGRRAA